MTRHEYINAPAESADQAHRQFYGQYVVPQLKSLVLRAIGLERLRASKDPQHLNDISLTTWDRIAVACRPLIAQVNRKLDGKATWSLCEGVCAAKEAARQLLEEA